MDNIQKSAIKKLVVLDTIFLSEERLIDKIEQISIAKLLAEAIIRIHEKRPLSPLFEIGNAKNLKKQEVGKSNLFSFDKNWIAMGNTYYHYRSE